MLLHLFLLLTFSSFIICDDCVIYTFENGAEDFLRNNYNVCIGQASWTVGSYSSLSISSPNPNSYSFISPATFQSCVTSFSFPVTAGGTIEINIYLNAAAYSDRLTIQLYEESNHRAAGNYVIAGSNIALGGRWIAAKINVFGFGTFNAYLSFSGSASANSILLVDSFRYISPINKEEECDTYNNEISGTTTTLPEFTIPVQAGNDCLTYNFEEDVTDFLTDNYNVCYGNALWSVGSYSSISVDSPNPNSYTFISPAIFQSCVTSFAFTMTSGGTIEVNIYLDAAAYSDRLTILVHRKNNHQTAGTYVIAGPNIQSGGRWLTAHVNIFGYGTFEGYLSFAGTASRNSLLLIDSFRYIPPSRDQDLCDIYVGSSNDSTSTTTTISLELSSVKTTESDISSTTVVLPEVATPEQSGNKCITYNFENNAEGFITNNFNICNGNSLWSVGSYSSLNIPSPNPDSFTFISPVSNYSCVTSFTFPITAGGTIEINVYVDLAANSDMITILVHQERNHQTVGNYVIAGSNIQSGGRWITAHVNVYGYGTFNGYLSLAGRASLNSFLLIDSFRYVPPNRDQDLCDIYVGSGNDSTSTTTTISLESSSVETTESDISSTTVALAEVTTPEQLGEECITYNFENNAEGFITNNFNICNGNSLWSVGSYSSLNIPGPNPNSFTFISPASIYSCVTSFTFPITAGGTIEINVYVDLTANSDMVTILVHQERNHQIVGNYVIARSNIQSGGRWITAHVNVYGYGTFNGYLAFTGMTSDNSILLIDSFKYIPPLQNDEVCNIYVGEDNNNTTSTTLSISVETLPTLTTTVLSTESTTSSSTVAPPESTTESTNKEDECISHNFEKDAEEFVTNNFNVCNNQSKWTVGRYSSSPIQSPNQASNIFISPTSYYSCFTSFPFQMTAGGTIEINIYYESASNDSQLTILAYKSEGSQRTVGNYVFTSNPTQGGKWITAHLNIYGFGTFNGYLSFTGKASNNSILIIDSFRYLPPSRSVDVCDIYKNTNESTTTESAFTTISLPSSDETSDTDPIITETSTVLPTTPEPGSSPEVEVIKEGNNVYNIYNWIIYNAGNFTNFWK